MFGLLVRGEVSLFSIASYFPNFDCLLLFSSPVTSDIFFSIALTPSVHPSNGYTLMSEMLLRGVFTTNQSLSHSAFNINVLKAICLCICTCLILFLCLGQRPFVFLSSRVHPGESNSSWVMKGLWMKMNHISISFVFVLNYLFLFNFCFIHYSRIFADTTMGSIMAGTESISERSTK